MFIHTKLIGCSHGLHTVKRSKRGKNDWEIFPPPLRQCHCAENFATVNQNDRDSMGYTFQCIPIIFSSWSVLAVWLCESGNICHLLYVVSYEFAKKVIALKNTRSTWRSIGVSCSKLTLTWCRWSMLLKISVLTWMNLGHNGLDKIKYLLVVECVCSAWIDLGLLLFSMTTVVHLLAASRGDI